jgi:Fe-S-cluster-containing dehydrogenase component
LKRVFIDLDLLDKTEHEGKLDIKCSYPYHDYAPYERDCHCMADRERPPDRPANNGVIALRETAAYAVICRKCESANCVNSCPTEALEKDEEGILRRYNMRCISCGSCAVACPFGTIYAETVPYLASRCDYCLERLKSGEVPLCVETSPDGIIQYVEIEPDEEKSIYKVGDHLVVKCEVWRR